MSKVYPQEKKEVTKVVKSDLEWRSVLTEEEYNKMKEKIIDRGRTELFLKPPQLVIFAISLIWLGIGIRQWIVISKWDKKYQRFKTKQADIDKKLLDDDAEDE